MEFLKNVNLPLQDILFIEADVNYSVFHLNSGKKVVIAKTLKSINELVDNQHFIRINKSSIINLCYLKEVQSVSQNLIITLSNGQAFSPSRRRKQSLKTLIYKLSQNS